MSSESMSENSWQKSLSLGSDPATPTAMKVMVASSRTGTSTLFVDTKQLVVHNARIANSALDLILESHPHPQRHAEMFGELQRPIGVKHAEIHVGASRGMKRLLGFHIEMDGFIARTGVGGVHGRHPHRVVT